MIVHVRRAAILGSVLAIAACASAPKEITHASFKEDPRKIAKAVSNTSSIGALDDSKKVIVPDFKVYFETKVGASGMAGDNRVSQKVQLGVDPSVLQEITDEMYKQFLADLKTAGYEVIESKQLGEQFEEWKKYEAEKMQASPVKVNEQYVEYAPTGMKLDLTGMEVGVVQLGGIFTTNINDVSARAASKLDAIRISPTFIVGFTTMDVEKGYKRTTVTSNQGMNVRPGSGWALHTGGRIWLEKQIGTFADVGTYQDADTAGDKVRGWASALSYALGGSTNNTNTKILVADPAKYKEGALEQMRLAEAIFLERAKMELE